MNLNEALAKLDPANDEHWTAEGLPRTDALAKLLGRTISRKEISEAAPELSRSSTVEADEAEASPPAEAQASLEDRLAEAHAAVVVAEAKVNEAKRELAEATAAEDAIISEREREDRSKPGHLRQQEHIMEHIRRHNERRSKSAPVQRAATSPPSKLDGALQASRKRPEFPGAGDASAQ